MEVMKLTPREPTPEMRTLGVVALRTVSDGDLDATTEEVASIWRAMHDAAPSGWQPIETAPKGTREMFVVRAFRVTPSVSGVFKYTSDPWCVWRNDDGSFARWPHNFQPTHWMPLPAPPSEQTQAAPSVPSVEQELRFQLLAASNYIDALGGDSKSYRAAIARAKGG